MMDESRVKKGHKILSGLGGIALEKGDMKLYQATKIAVDTLSWVLMEEVQGFDTVIENAVKSAEIQNVKFEDL